MRLASYRHQGKTACGIVAEQGIIDIPSHPQNTLKLGPRPKEFYEPLQSGMF